MIVRDAIGRIDQVLREQPLPEPAAGHTPSDASVTLDHVSYSYHADGAPAKDSETPQSIK